MMKKNKRNMQLILKLKLIFKMYFKKEEELNLESQKQIDSLHENLKKIEHEVKNL